MWYLLMLVNLGYYTQITLSFLLVGHTKFACDWAFGLAKSAFRRNFVSSLEDLVNVINGSTPVSKVNEAVLVGNEQGDVFITYYDWKKYFDAMNLKRIPDLSKYHHFIFRNSCPNSIFVKVSADDPEIEISLMPMTQLQFHFHLDNVETVSPNGLSPQRKKYLFEHIRQYCAPGTEDILCPQPSQIIEEAENEDDPAPLVNPNLQSDPVQPINPVLCPEPPIDPMPCPPRRGRGRPRKILKEIDISNSVPLKKIRVENVSSDKTPSSSASQSIRRSSQKTDSDSEAVKRNQRYLSFNEY